MKFKKCTSLFLAFLLLVSNMGFAFTVHYCRDEVASISLKPDFTSLKSNKNCCGIIKNKSGCCESKIVHFQEKFDNVVVKGFAFQYENPLVVIELHNPVLVQIYNSHFNFTPQYICNVHPPPLYKLHSQYIFYDRF